MCLTRVIPVMLDVGTNRESLLGDPMYIGNRHARIRGERYDDFIDAYVTVVKRLFPNALLQWEDFAPGTGRRILEKYRDRSAPSTTICKAPARSRSAAAISAVRVCGTPLRNQRVVIFGAGTAGIGVADQIRDAMVREGLSKDDAATRFWCVDRTGLLTTEDHLSDYRASYARAIAECKSWKYHGDGMSLAEVIRRVKPTMLIGASTAAGSFTEAIVKEMAAHAANACWWQRTKVSKLWL